MFARAMNDLQSSFSHIIHRVFVRRWLAFYITVNDKCSLSSPQTLRGQDVVPLLWGITRFDVQIWLNIMRQDYRSLSILHYLRNPCYAQCVIGQSHTARCSDNSLMGTGRRAGVHSSKSPGPSGDHIPILGTGQRLDQ
jgi:hypothetical protein